MADWDNRTMPASPRRRLEARQRGEVAQSRLLRVAGQLLVAVVAVSWLGSQLIDALAGMMRASLAGAAGGAAGGIDGSGAEVVGGVIGLVEPTAMAVLPVLIAAGLASVLIGLIQTRWLWAPAAMAPRWERINPASGLGRMLGGLSVTRAVTVVSQLLIIVVLGGWLVASRWGELLAEATVAGSTASGLLEWLTGEGLQLAGVVAVGLLVLGGLDYGYQRWRFEQQLKMTPQEWREEQRESQAPRRRRVPVPATFQQRDQSVN
jgi:flagellar biosynthetic protein FlhB